MPAMWTSALSLSSTWLAGFTVCFTLIATLGAQNLYVLRQVVKGSHVRACVLWCVVSDILLIGLGVAGMAKLLSHAPELTWYMAVGGASFLVAYGLFAWRRALYGGDAALVTAGRSEHSLLRVLGTLAALTLLNPHVYLDTVILIGSIGARQEGGLKWIFVTGAASASLVWFLLLALAGKRLQGVFAHPRAWRLLDAVTGGIMLLLAWWIWRDMIAG